VAGHVAGVAAVRTLLGARLAALLVETNSCVALLDAAVLPALQRLAAQQVARYKLLVAQHRIHLLQITKQEKIMPSSRNK